jgi:hypothetical protein
MFFDSKLLHYQFSVFNILNRTQVKPEFDLEL